MSRTESISEAPCNQMWPWIHQLQHGARELLSCSRYTLSIALTTTVIFAFPALTSWLQLDFAAVITGQWWRVFSGHLTHYDGQHLFWDLLMFVVLGAICERHNKQFFVVFLISMSTIVSLTVMFACSSITEYRGLSGMDTGLFAWLTITQLRASLAGRDRYFAAFWATSGLLLIGKLGFEMFTGDVLFVQADGFEPILESHLAGAAVGITFAAGTALRSNGAQRVPIE